MERSTLIFLNGTSSSGKTSIARALQKIMDQPYLYISADLYTTMLPPYREGLDWVVDDILDLLRFGFYRSLAAMCATGNHVVADHVMVRPVLIAACAEALAPHRAFLVGVRCPVEIARQRETDRGDRKIGLVEDQHHAVHGHGIYDFEVDTSTMTPEQCAAAIAAYCAGHEPAAFSRLSAPEVLSHR